MGLIGTTAGHNTWAKTHAALPAVLQREPGCADIFASSRDERGRASIVRARLTMRPEVAIAGPVEQVLAPGELGAFDDSGVTMSCVVESESAVFLYYTGWMLGVTVPFYLAAGLAISEDGGATFRRASLAPLLERDDVDPFLTASPFVLRDERRWQMWYVSGTEWAIVDGAPRHRYHIKYAESSDGIAWRRDGRVCIDYASDAEYAFARPFVERDGNIYRMWYSFRGTAYRIGYAESRDGLTWRRYDDHRGLAPSESGWDSTMVEYPWLFASDGVSYMLYNGNDYGREGIGLAAWEQDTVDPPVSTGAKS